MKQHFIKCVQCGKEFQASKHKKFCSSKCRGYNWFLNNKEKVKASSKRSYEKAKSNGTAYYQTEKGRMTNRNRSRIFRLRHENKVREYKKLKAREYSTKKKALIGKTKTAEEMKKIVEACRLWQRIRRQSIKGSSRTACDLDQKDIQALKLDCEELQEKISNLRGN